MFCCKKIVIWYKNTTDSLNTTTHLSILARSHDRAQNDNRPYHFCAKNEYIDGQFLQPPAVAVGKDRSPIGRCSIYRHPPDDVAWVSLNKQALNTWSGRTDEGAKRPVLQLPAVHVYSQRGARSAVFHDIIYITDHHVTATADCRRRQRIAVARIPVTYSGYRLRIIKVTHFSNPKYCPPSTRILTLDIHSSEAPATATFPSNLKRWLEILSAGDLLSSDWQSQRILELNIKIIKHNPNFANKPQPHPTSIFIHRIFNVYTLGMLMINSDNLLSGNRIRIIIGGSFFSCTICVVFKIFTLFYKNVVH